jgi:hypothetical protein
MSQPISFKLGNSQLAKKPGHTRACSQLEAVLTVTAESVEEALADITTEVEDTAFDVELWEGATLTVTVRKGSVSKRDVVKS